MVIKYAPGHTPGHQTLFLKLKKFGPLLVAGDLYHFPEEQTMNRFPGFEFNKEDFRRRVEWGKAGEPPSTYLADGWARQRESVASPLTVFELALHYVEVLGSQGPAVVRGRPTPLAVRVVVDEATGDATLTRGR